MEVTPHLWRQVNVENLSQLGIRRGELSCWPDDCNRPGINRLWHCCHSRNSVFRFKFKSARRYKTNYLIWLVFALSNDFDRFRLLDKAWFETAIFPVINLTKMPFSCSLLAPGKQSKRLTLGEVEVADIDCSRKMPVYNISMNTKSMTFPNTDFIHGSVTLGMDVIFSPRRGVVISVTHAPGSKRILRRWTAAFTDRCGRFAIWQSASIRYSHSFTTWLREKVNSITSVNITWRRYRAGKELREKSNRPLPLPIIGLPLGKLGKAIQVMSVLYHVGLLV